MPPLEIQVFSPSSTIVVAVGAGSAGHGRDVGAGFLFGKRKGRQPFAGAHLRQHAAALLAEPDKADRAGAEALHREGEVGEPVMPGKRLAGEADEAEVDRGLGVRAADRSLEKAGVAERAHQLAAGAVDIVMVDRGNRARS